MNAIRERYKVLLVDDEPIILRSLKAVIPWDELELAVAGEARNGEAALRLIEEQRPQIVISDIRMPAIDGITLMKEVMSRTPKPLFIFISGYGEFEYAREALRQGAFDYLLKPIDHDELTAMLARACEKLDKQRRDDVLLHSVQMLSMLARERMFTEYTQGNSRPMQHLEWLESSELDGDYFMAVLQLDHFGALSVDWSDGERRLWQFAVRNIAEEWLDRRGGLAVFPYHGGEWVLLFPGALAESRRELGEELIEAMKRYAKLSASVALSRTGRGINSLNALYRQTAEVLSRRYYAGQAGVFLEEERAAADTPQTSLRYPREIERALADSLRMLDEEEMRARFGELEAYLESRSLPREDAQRIITELTVVLFRQVEDMRPAGTVSPGALLERLQSLETLAETISALGDTFGGLIAESRRGTKEDGQRQIEKARRYIESNYHKDLGIEEVAELAELSVSHFCTLFKQLTGYTFLEYVTHCRMEKAKYILLGSDVKVYRVAPLVGYQDPRYFTQVFKKATGMTPSEFRESRET